MARTTDIDTGQRSYDAWSSVARTIEGAQKKISWRMLGMHAFQSPMLGRPRCDWSGLAVVAVVVVERVFFGHATSTHSEERGQLGWPDPSLWQSRTSLKKAHLPHTGSPGCGGSDMIGGFVGTGGH